jgi:hypothetical protein
MDCGDILSVVRVVSARALVPAEAVTTNLALQQAV